MQLALELLGLLGGCAAVALIVILGGAALVRRSAPRPATAWRQRYRTAFAIGAALGALAGVVVTFLGMAVMGGLPAPWNILVLPLGGLAGGVALGTVAAVLVALVHAASRLRGGAAEPAGPTATDPD
ncbi:hypothetical protein LLH23_08455 [bacterium]|nr:hypothetical protein [bacterium]